MPSPAEVSTEEGPVVKCYTLSVKYVNETGEWAHEVISREDHRLVCDSWRLQ